MSKVGEFFVNNFDLLLGERELLAINKALDDRKLVNQHKVGVVSVEVDRVKVGEEKLVVEVVLVPLVNLETADGAANLE